MRVLIAGGGTGGHLFPAVALAEKFRARDPSGGILFVGTDSPLEISTLSKRGFDHLGIAAGALKGLGPWRQIRSLANIPKGFWQAALIIRRFKPDIIIGVGGYSSGPVALAAGVMGKRMVIHEQNLLPGFTNRILGLFAQRIFISFPDSVAAFNGSRTVLTGNPVRRDVLAARGSETATEGLTILVVGGSQGAHAINRAVVDALGHLGKPARMSFIHQTGPKDVGWVAGAYEGYGIRATVQSFFDDMANAYRVAELVVCRAGATTVAELTALGKPAIFIPFPFAANNHQELNARYVSDAGGGEVILEKDLDGVLLASRIDDYASNPKALHDMSARALALGRPEAADIIVDECQRIVIGH